jgi:hypothetical protein
VVRFTATFNAPLVGGYDWNVVGNTNIPILRIQKNQLALIERYSFSATVNEGAFLDNVITVPTLAVRLPRENRLIYPNPIPLVNYVDGLETLIYAFADQAQNLEGTFRGQVGQGVALVGIPNLIAQVQFNIYMVKNLDWIDNFLGRTEDGQAHNLVFPRRRK